MGWHQAAELGPAGVPQQRWCPLLGPQLSLPDNDPHLFMLGP